MSKLSISVGVFHPAARAEENRFQSGLAQMKQLYTAVVESGIERHPHRYFAASSDEIIREWEFFQQNEKVDILMAARGGAGSQLLVNYLKHSGTSIGPGPIVVGFSDITALMWFLYANYRVPSIYGPVVAWHYAHYREWGSASQFEAMLSGTNVLSLGNIHPLYQPVPKGKPVSGILIPACLSILAEVLLPGDISDDVILFMEDINEKAYKLERYLRLLEYKGIMPRVRAMFLGEFSAVDHPEWVEASAAELGEKYGFPVYSGISFGHHLNSVNLPFGVNGIFDPATQMLSWESFL